MRFAAVFLVAFACSGALASEPGQPLDCTDWIMLDPGITCREIACGWEPSAGHLAFPCEGLSGSNVDALGRIVNFDRTETLTCNGSKPGRLELKFFDGVSEHLAAVLDGRCVQGNCADGAVLQGRTVDPVGGRVFALIQRRDFNCDSTPYSDVDLFVFEGFPTLYDVLQSFAPPPSTIGFRVPYMPEGMAGADHFDTYWGALTKPLDFTQAHPMQCGYPEAAPHVGDYLTVADTVPTPAPGQGVYYVTSATHQGATRYGRKTSAGHISGRDPAALPVCLETSH